MRTRTRPRLRRTLVVVAILTTVVVVAATAAYALLGGAVPSQTAVTYTVPTSHVSDASPLNVTLGTYTSEFGTFPTMAVLTSTLAARSLTGEEHVHCALTIGSPARVIGSSDQAGNGANLGSTAYQQSTIAITGTYTANATEDLKLSCSTHGVSDAILTNTHAVIQQVTSQIGGP